MCVYKLLCITMYVCMYVSILLKAHLHNRALYVDMAGMGRWLTGTTCGKEG